MRFFQLSFLAGYLERSKLENDKAVSHFEGGLELYRQLAQRDPEQYLPNVAEALNSLAVTERDEKRMDEARRHYGRLADLTFPKLMKRQKWPASFLNLVSSI